jgi:hypothetical protein
VGYKLSLSLYRYSHAIASRGKAIERYVGSSKIPSLALADECKTAFEELEIAVGKYIESGKLKLKDRLKWPFVEKRVTLLRVNLDRLKSTLMLMLEVLKYARSIAKYKHTPLYGCYETHLVQTWAGFLWG